MFLFLSTHKPLLLYLHFSLVTQKIADFVEKLLKLPHLYYLRLHNIVAAPISQDWLGILKIGLDVQKGLEFS